MKWLRMIICLLVRFGGFMLNVRLFWLFSAIVSRFFGNLADIFASVSAKKKKKNVREIVFYFLAFPKSGLWVFL